MGTKVEMRLKL